MTSGVHAEGRHAVAGNLLPVQVALPSLWVEKHPAGVVALGSWVGVEVEQQRASDLVGSQDVQPLVDHERRRRKGLNEREDAGANPMGLRAGLAAALNGPGEVVEVGALVLA